MKKVCSLLLFCIFTFGAFAQIGSTSPFNTSSSSSTHYSRCGVCGLYHYPQCTPPPKPAPFDGGLTLLLVAGAAYGAKRFRNKKEA